MKKILIPVAFIAALAVPAMAMAKPDNGAGDKPATSAPAKDTKKPKAKPAAAKPAAKPAPAAAKAPKTKPAKEKEAQHG